MYRRRTVCKAGCSLLGSVALVLACPATHAQGSASAAAASAPGHDSDGLDIEAVKTGLYLVTGGGGHSLLRFSANGMILVNAKRPGTYRALRAQMRRASRIADQPLRVLFVTDAQDAHIGNAGPFLAAGVPIVAQANALGRLSSAVATAGPAATASAASGDGRAAAPTIGFDRDYTLKLGGIEVRLMHFGSAHTDADTVVLFPDLKVIAVGGLYTAQTPVPDATSHGSLVRWASVLGDVMRLDFDVVVPSRGPLLNRAELAAFASRLQGFVSRADALAKAGVSGVAWRSRVAGAEPGWTFTDEQLDRVAAELSTAR